MRLPIINAKVYREHGCNIDLELTLGYKDAELRYDPAVPGMGTLVFCFITLTGEEYPVKLELVYREEQERIDTIMAGFEREKKELDAYYLKRKIKVGQC